MSRMDANDPQTGISIRFVRSYDIKADTAPKGYQMTMFDYALALVMSDERDIPATEKLADAFAFLKSRIH